jgi:hypothetical protein
MSQPTGQHQDDRWVAYMTLAELGSAPRNPRRHNLPELRAALARFGVGQLPMLDERTGLLVAGHGRRDALAALEAAGDRPPRYVRVGADGVWRVPVLRGWTSTDWLEADGYLAADNRQSELAAWDLDGLVDLLGDQDDFAGLGWTDDEIDRLLDPPLPGDSTEDGDADSSAQGDDTDVDEITGSDGSPSRWPDYGVLVICDDQTEQAAVVEDLRAQGLTCKPLHT